jgi:hypothetical protein
MYRIKCLLQINPALPQLKARLKIRKEDIPIWSAVKNINALAYKLAKFLGKVLDERNNIPNTDLTSNFILSANTLLNIDSSEIQTDNTKYRGPICQHTNQRNNKNYEIFPTPKQHWPNITAANPTYTTHNYTSELLPIQR